MTRHKATSVIDVTLIALLIGLAGLLDVLLHVRLDLQKQRSLKPSGLQDHGLRIASWVMFLVVLSTVLSFVIVFLFLVGLGPALASLGLLFDPPPLLSILAAGLVILGFILHGWSRYVRHEMASSWAMHGTHTLITRGPYARVRHPSYTSYMLSFIGLFLFIPTLITILTLVGIPGYYFVARTEEELLLIHFGDEYREYIERTGRFLPI